jgi:hypothetical protein
MWIFVAAIARSIERGDDSVAASVLNVDKLAHILPGSIGQPICGRIGLEESEIGSHYLLIQGGR